MHEKMDDTTLRAYIKQVSERIPDEDLPLLAGCAQHRHVKKGERLLTEGEICRSFYLVEKGHLRSWTDKDGTAINLNFAFEGNFTTNLKSLNGREPSELIIEAGEDTLVWVFDLDKIAEQHKLHPQIVVFIRRLAIYILLAAEEHSNLFKMYTPSERYRYIEKNNPQLLQRISLSQMASYLGVARETLSRIRSKNQ